MVLTGEMERVEVLPLPPPPPLRKRQTDDTGGEAPPISKAKSGDTPSASASTSPRQARCEAARKLLLAKGLYGFPSSGSWMRR